MNPKIEECEEKLPIAHNPSQYWHPFKRQKNSRIFIKRLGGPIR